MNKTLDEIKLAAQQILEDHSVELGKPSSYTCHRIIDIVDRDYGLSRVAIYVELHQITKDFIASVLNPVLLAQEKELVSFREDAFIHIYLEYLQGNLSADNYAAFEDTRKLWLNYIINY